MHINVVYTECLSILWTRIIFLTKRTLIPFIYFYKISTMSYLKSGNGIFQLHISKNICISYALMGLNQQQQRWLKRVQLCMDKLIYTCIYDMAENSLFICILLPLLKQNITLIAILQMFFYLQYSSKTVTNQVQFRNFYCDTYCSNLIETLPPI